MGDTFILRDSRGHLYTGEQIRSWQIEQRTTKHVTTVPGIGPIGTSVGTGKMVAGKLRVQLWGSEKIRDWFGRGHGASTASAYVERSAAGVKARLRRARPQELTAIEAIDADIAATEQRLAELRLARKTAVRQAWQRGNVVRLSEVEAVLSEKTW